MQRPSDEALVAYLDGELDGAARKGVAEALERDTAVRDQANGLTESASLLRAAMAEIVREEVPERLLAVARGTRADPTGGAIDFLAVQARRLGLVSQPRRWDEGRWLKAAIAASLFCLVIGAGGGYLIANGADDDGSGAQPPAQSAVASAWLDNIAGYHRLLINAGVNERGLVDVPPAGQHRASTPKLPAGFRLPNLKSWGLAYEGARFLVIEGRPATQLFYTSSKKKLGSITIVVGSSAKPDLLPAVERRNGMNFIYWRHKGHAYALVGGADVGYLWHIAKDIANQLGTSA